MNSSANSGHSATSPSPQERTRNKIAIFGVLAAILAAFLIIPPVLLSGLRSSLASGEAVFDRIAQERDNATEAAASCSELPLPAQPDCHRRVWERESSSESLSSEAAVAWLRALSKPALPLSSEASVGEAARLGHQAASSEARALKEAAALLRKSCAGITGIICPDGTDATADAFERIALAIPARVLEAEDNARKALRLQAAPPEAPRSAQDSPSGPPGPSAP